MSDDILDIEKWEFEYPFLKEVSYAYEDLNNNAYDDVNESTYNSLCFLIIQSAKGDIQKHNDVCKKLMRNLRHFSVNKIYYEISKDRCNILFHWLYNYLDKGKITYPVIEKCFETYDEFRLKKENTSLKCHYHKDIKYDEPKKITLLDIFNDNTYNIQQTLMTGTQEIQNRCRKFVCKCLNIYQYMNKKYCLIPSEQSPKQNGTCLKLGEFASSYKFLRSNIVSLNPNIPSLDDEDYEFSEKCLPDEKGTLLRSDRVKTRDQLLGNGLSAHTGDQDPALTDGLPGTHGNADSPMRKTITTTIGTFAGASSLLAFLYKFTPAGRLVNPKLRRTTGMINNNFYGDDANGMLFDGNEHNGLNSYNIGYEAA